MNDATAAGPGQLVRAGRESRKLSQQDIADTLNLTLRVVADIEAENWARLPPTAFTRGYLRAYARLLELDPDQVTRAFDTAVGRGAMAETATASPSGSSPSAALGRSATMPKMHRARRGGVAELLQKHPGAVLTGAVALVICAVLVVLWAVWPDAPERSIPERQTATAPNSTKPAVAAEPVEPAPVAVAPESPAPATVDTPDATQPVEARAVDSNGARRITSGGDDRLSFVFTDNCWVEIKDPQGVRLFGDLGLAGTSLELVGQAPFRILLGNAPGVTLSFNGERVALTPHTRNNVGTLVLGQ